MAPLKVGIVGLAQQSWAAGSHVPAITRLGDSFTLSALATRTKDKAESSAKHFSSEVGNEVLAFSGDTASADLANSKDVDFVTVAVPLQQQTAAAKRALEAGKQLLLEWPAGHGLKDATELAELAKTKGVRNFVGTQSRFAPAIVELKKLVDTGKLGAIVSSNITAIIPKELMFRGPLIPDNSKFFADKDAGATMIDIEMAHVLDDFMHVLGPIASISALIDTHYTTATVMSRGPRPSNTPGQPTGETVTVTGPDQVALSARLQSGVVAGIHWTAGVSGMTPGRPVFRWTVEGEEGSALVEGVGMFGFALMIQDPKLFVNGEEMKLPEDGLSSVQRMWASIAKDEGVAATLEDAVRVKKVGAAVFASAAEGRKIDIQ